MAVNIPCDYCGRSVSSIVDQEGNCSCVECYQRFYTCYMCDHAVTCEFENNPSPIPKQIQQTVQRGPMIMQTVIKNPDRVKAFCFPCKCFDQDELICLREDNWCKNYKENAPRFRQERLKD